MWYARNYALGFLASALILLDQVWAQPEPQRPHFAAGLMGGVGNSYAYWVFAEADLSGKRVEGRMYPGASFTVEVFYGPLVCSHGSEVWTSLSLGYSETQTENVRISPSGMLVGSAGIQRLAVVGWLILTTDNVLSPYIKVGMGTARTDFRESYSLTWARNIRFHQWNIAYGAEGGVTYRLLPNVDLSALLVNWWTTKKILDKIPNYEGERNGINGPFGIWTLGIGFRYRFP